MQNLEQYKKLDKKAINIEFEWACSSGNLELVKFFLTSSELKHKANIHSHKDTGLLQASKNGHFEVVKYLLASPDLKKHANIHAQDSVAFYLSCFTGELEIVKYLLTSPDLKKHANIHAKNDMGFKRACDGKKIEIIKYLIFDMNIQKTIHIQEHLESTNNENIQNMFTLRELNKKLKEELPSEKTNENKFKL